MTIKQFCEDVLYMVLPELNGITSYGFINKDKERAIGVYERQTEPVNAYGKSSYSIKRLRVLVHWTKSSDMCEQMAEQISKKLDRYKTNNGWVDATPSIELGRDENEIFERVIDLTIYTKEE